MRGSPSRLGVRCAPAPPSGAGARPATARRSSPHQQYVAPPCPPAANFRPTCAAIPLLSTNIVDVRYRCRVKIAPDGSPVGLYLRLPERVEDAALIDGLLPCGASVLDLGCGTGRLAEPLARLGHEVTGVDNEPEMLASLRSVRGVAADIGSLDLGERFDAVLLMSHFVNAADTGLATAALDAVRRHLVGDGFAVVERYPVGWAHTCVEHTTNIGGVRCTLHDLRRRDGVLTAIMRYEFDGVVAEQRFSARDVDDARLAELAEAADLRVDRALTDVKTLVVLRPA
ncbi:MAG: methyltransferase domain-containing protein [Sciscionella sp.]|nr:methyltransferase domain-containing protein [Sciscionella sp.]